MPLRKIVIVGGGTAGWMTAAALSRLKPAVPLDITLIESDAIATVGVGEATIPPFQTFNRRLELDEAEWMSAVQGTFKLGIHFVNWLRKGDSYFHPFGDFGYDIGGCAFPQIWLKYRLQGESPPLHRYNAETMAAMNRKFAIAPPNQREDLPPVNYAYHLDATAYARYLRSYAEKRGVVRQEGKVVDVSQHGESGFVSSVTMEGGKEIAGDLFVDCSGFRGLLIEQTLKSGFTDWSHWLPCDRAVAIQSAGDGTVLPYTRSTAWSAGWQWRVPLQKRNGNGVVYCSAHMEQQEALDILLNNIDGEPLTEPNNLRFVAGHRNKMWNKNVVAIGLSGGFLEPLESTSIHLINTGINKLISLLAFDGITKEQEQAFNRFSKREYEQIRDFIILHYKATERDDSDFWNYCRTMSIPDSLEEKIELFRLNGQVFRENEELFTLTSWTAVMLGQGISPIATSPLCYTMEEPGLSNELGEMRKSIEYLVSKMPSHDEFLKSYCPAA